MPLAESCIPVLETERLVLRAPHIEDVAAVAELANNRRIAEMTANLPFPYKLSDAHAFVETLAAVPDAATFGVFLKGEGRMAFAGMVSYGRRPPEPAPELGYWVGEAFWGRGIATEAVRAVIDYAFSETDAPPSRLRPRGQSGVAPGAGEVRLPVVRRRPVPREGAARLRAGGPVPAGAAHLGLHPRLGSTALPRHRAAH